MPDFKIIETETTGDVYIKTNTQYNNLKADKVVVAENVSARLYGTIKELLVIKTGGQVMLHGTIKGKIENNGSLSIY